MTDDREPAGLEKMWRELGRQLAALRREAGLSQQALGELTNYSRPTISVAEIGRPIQAPEFWQACECATRRCCYPDGGERPSVALSS